MTSKSNETGDEDLRELVSQMTVEEKIGQMTIYNGFWDVTGPTPEQGDAKRKLKQLKAGHVGAMLNVHGVDQVREFQRIAVEESRLGIPLLFGLDVIHGHKTLSPIPLAETASWDLKAIEQSARNAAREAAARGINWTFAPMVDVSRDARWGRVMEGAGEDPYLGSVVARARVKGFQGNDLNDRLTIAACAKHFAAYGFSEAGRDYNIADVGSYTLHNVILPPFKASVEAGVASFMNGFNTLNGIPVTGDRKLQRGLLKEQWQFDGFIVSDWGSIGEMVAHGYAKDLKDAATKAFLAGCDMDMESFAYETHLLEYVGKDSAKIALLDEAVLRILRVKKHLGLFEDPYLYCNPELEDSLVYHDKHQEDALELAKNSMVLLKNQDNLLPLDGTEKVAVIGSLAEDKNSPLGSWRIASDDHTAVSVLEGLDALNISYDYAPGVKFFNDSTSFFDEVVVNEEDTTGMERAQRLASTSDVVVMVLGEHGFQSGEGRSRSQLDLPGLQQKLLEAVHKVNKNIVLVVMAGRPLVLNWADENIPSILMAWQLGTQSGHAIAQTLFGHSNPSGKLPMCFPRSVGQMPLYYNRFNTGRPGPQEQVFWSHYIDEKNAPLYPFGFGLSYTNFEYSNFQLKDFTRTEGMLELSVNVKNTGKVNGREIVQLYIRDHYTSSAVRPIIELKDFQPVHLAPGGSKKVVFKLPAERLGFYDQQGNFLIEEGAFDIMIGRHSGDLLKKKFQLTQDYSQ